MATRMAVMNTISTKRLKPAAIARFLPWARATSPAPVVGYSRAAEFEPGLRRRSPFRRSSCKPHICTTRSIAIRHSRLLGIQIDRKSVVEGKSVSVRVDLGGRRIIKTKKEKQHTNDQ